MRHAFLLVSALVIASSALAQGGGGAFDPSSYIHEQEQEAAEKSQQLKSRSIFRINGHRFQKFESNVGAVFLPSDGERPEILAEFALCPQHLQLMTEVLPMRENLAIEKDLMALEPKIVALIQRCIEGKIKSPVQAIENPDGSITEIRAKEADPRGRPAAANSAEGPKTGPKSTDK